MFRLHAPRYTRRASSLDRWMSDDLEYLFSDFGPSVREHIPLTELEFAFETVDLQGCCNTTEWSEQGRRPCCWRRWWKRMMKPLSTSHTKPSNPQIIDLSKVNSEAMFIDYFGFFKIIHIHICESIPTWSRDSVLQLTSTQSLWNKARKWVYTGIRNVWPVVPTVGVGPSMCEIYTRTFYSRNWVPSLSNLPSLYNNTPYGEYCMQAITIMR